MIIDPNNTINPILLSVSLIFLLILVELGNIDLKRKLRPFVIVLVVVFLIIASIDIVSIYLKL